MKKNIVITLMLLMPLIASGQERGSNRNEEGKDQNISLKGLINELGDLVNGSPRTMKPFVVSAGIAYDIGEDNGLIKTSLGYFFTPRLEAEYCHQPQ